MEQTSPSDETSNNISPPSTADYPAVVTETPNSNEGETIEEPIMQTEQVTNLPPPLAVDLLDDTIDHDKKVDELGPTASEVDDLD